MRGRTWNSWTQFDTVDEPSRGKDGIAGSSSARSPRDTLGKPKRAGCERSLPCATQRAAITALERAMDLSEVRLERVARVRTAIAAHGYGIPVPDLAQKLLQTMLGDYT